MLTIIIVIIIIIIIESTIPLHKMQLDIYTKRLSLTIFINKRLPFLT
jgi:hypothetical protein